MCGEDITIRAFATRADLKNHASNRWINVLLPPWKPVLENSFAWLVVQSSQRVHL
jgi:hypothetical protein